jgi:hypothetical protein
MTRRLIVLLIAFLTVPLASYGSAVGWTVNKASGAASYSQDGGSQLPVQTGTVLQDGASVTTGENGRVLLVRNEETVFVGPNTIASIAGQLDNGLKTTVHLQRGAAEFNIQKRSEKHFSVQTPYMAAIVKGTQFVVTVGSDSAEVAVMEGLVEVKTEARSVDVAAGKKATVGRSGQITLAEGKSNDATKSTQQNQQDEANPAETTAAKIKPHNKTRNSKNKDNNDSNGKTNSSSGSSGIGGSSGSSGSGSSGSGGGGSSGSGGGGSSGSGGGGSSGSGGSGSSGSGGGGSSGGSG